MGYEGRVNDPISEPMVCVGTRNWEARMLREWQEGGGGVGDG